MKKSWATLLAAIILLLLVGIAFKISLLFGVFYLAGGAYTLIQRGVRKPLMPLLWLLGGIVIHIALSQFLVPIFDSETLVDLIIALVVFLLVFLVGHKIKKGKF